MKGVTPEVIAEVRSRAQIMDVISETVVLKRAGKDYKGLCPFHGDRSPSFHVSPDKGIYKCFACGEGGDVFAFVQKSKGVDFIESVRVLAQKFGVPLVESVEDRKEYDRRTQILMLYQQASEYYIQLLKHPSEGAVARKYLEDRGLSPDTIERFRLGFAPPSWDGLLNYLTDKTKVAPATLEEAGLVRKRQEGTGCYDLFRNRLMIPICDAEGKVIAFGGRTLGEDQVKYLNSPESPIYHKGQHLFGFNLAKDSIKQRDSVIVVEGYFDAITSHQFGFTNTVATLGTALTEQQAKQLVRYTDKKRVYLGFDADNAGARAVESGSEVLTRIAEGIGIELRVVNIPGGKDPDECLRSGDQGEAAYQAAIDNAPLMLDYRLEKAIDGIDTSTSLGKIEASRRVVPVLAQISSAIARSEYIRVWALKLGIREEQWLIEVGEFRRANRLDQPQGGQRGYSNYNGGYGGSGYRNYQNGSGGQYQNGRNQYQGGQSQYQGGQNQYGNKTRGNNNFAGGNAYSGSGSGSGYGSGYGASSGAGENRGGQGQASAGLRPRTGGDVDPFAEAAADSAYDASAQGSLDGPAPGEDREIAPPVARAQGQGFGGPGQGFGGPGQGQGFGGPGQGQGFGGPGQGQGFGGPGQGQGFGGPGQGQRQFQGQNKGGGKWKKKEKEIADEESMPMPFYVQTRRAPLSGLVESERQLLALYLTSQEDYEIAIRDLAEDRMLTPAHRVIKQAVEGVGSGFETIEDLKYQVMNRIGGDPEASKAIVDVIYKAEEFRKQKAPVQVVLKESRARLLKERISLLISESRGRLMSDDESEAMRMQGRIIELTNMDVKVLPNIATVEELDDLRRKLDAIEDDQVK